jgi:hypothetical protein
VNNVTLRVPTSASQVGGTTVSAFVTTLMDDASASDVADVKQLVNSVIDDLQALGLVG